jgi:phage terminase large subunit-like protein
MTRGEKVIAFIERYCVIPEGAQVGKPIVLEQFQKDFILEIYDGDARRAILSIGRKNGKSALIACLVLVHLVGPEAKQNTQIISGARSRDQAALVFNLACKMIRLSPQLQKITRIVPSSKKLIGLPMNVEYQAIAAEGKTAHGLSPVVAILDELGQVSGQTDAFIEAVITSQGAHDKPLLIVISTQAANDSDMLSLWIDDAQNDSNTVCHVYSAPKDADLLDEEAWKAANPALGKFRSLDDMRQMAEQAARMPSFENAFRNLYLNQRVTLHSAFISRDAWVACSDAPIPLHECDEVYGGLDLSGKLDLTALVLIGVKEGAYHAHCHFWTPKQGLTDRSKRDRAPYDIWASQGLITATEGATVDYGMVAEEIADLCSDINLVALAFDRWRIDIFKKELERIGVELPLVEFGQGFKDMSPAVDAVESMVLNKTLRHGAHPVLTMCANNAIVVRSPAGDRKLDKSKASVRIDGMVALAMAGGIAQRNHESTGRLDDFIFNPLVL